MLFNKEHSDPQKLFSVLLGKGIKWDVRYEQATINERRDWGNWDLISRCARSLKSGLPVYFMDKSYQQTKRNSFNEVATQLEIALSTAAGVQIVQDDERGMILVLAQVERMN